MRRNHSALALFSYTMQETPQTDAPINDVAPSGHAAQRSLDSTPAMLSRSPVPVDDKRAHEALQASITRIRLNAANALEKLSKFHDELAETGNMEQKLALTKAVLATYGKWTPGLEPRQEDTGPRLTLNVTGVPWFTNRSNQAGPRPTVTKAPLVIDAPEPRYGSSGQPAGRTAVEDVNDLLNISSMPVDGVPLVEHMLDNNF